jgi:glutathione reductase (NADPH)
MTLRPHTVLQRVDKLPTGELMATLAATDGGAAAATAAGPFDAIVLAVGRIPNTMGLHLDKAGVALGPCSRTTYHRLPCARVVSEAGGADDADEDGYIRVDDYQNTSAPGTYAVGDVVRTAHLTPVAVAAGRLLSNRLFGGQPNARMDYRDVPTVVFSHPPIGAVGATEEEARATHGDAAVKIYTSKVRAVPHAPRPRPDQDR